MNNATFVNPNCKLFNERGYATRHAAGTNGVTEAHTIMSFSPDHDLLFCKDWEVQLDSEVTS